MPTPRKALPVVDAARCAGGGEKASGVVVADHAGGPDRDAGREMRQIERHVVRRSTALELAGDDFGQRFLLRPVLDHVVVINQPATAADDAFSFHARMSFCPYRCRMMLLYR